MESADEGAVESRWQPNYERNVDQTNRAQLAEFTPKGRDDVFAFLRTVRQSFENNGVYLEFLAILQNYRANSVSVPLLVQKVEALFKDRPDLFMEFKAFVPKVYEDQKIHNLPADLSQALTFVKKIKVQDEQMYARFLSILSDFREGNGSLENVYSQVADLWKNRPDLMEEFVCFFPKAPSNRCAPQANMKTLQAKQSHLRETDAELAGLESSSQKCCHRNYEIHQHFSAKSKGRQHEKQADRVNSEHRQLVSAQNLAEGNETAFFVQKEKKSFDELGKEQTCGHEQGRISAVPITNFLKRKLNFLRHVESSWKEKFEEYLKCLEMRSDGITTNNDFYLQIVDMFSKSPELIGDSMDLVRECETAELEIECREKASDEEPELVKRNWSHACRKRTLEDQSEWKANMEQRKKNKRELPCASLDANIEEERDSNKPSLPKLKPPCKTDLEENHTHCSFPCTSSMQQNNSRIHPFNENPHKSSYATSRKLVEQENSMRHPRDKSPNKKLFPSSHATSSESLEQENNKRRSSEDNPCTKSSPSSHTTSSKDMEQETSKRHSTKENPHSKPSHATGSKSLEQENIKRHPFKDDPHCKFSQAISSNKYLNKPLSELDLSKWEQCTPSYHRLPDDYPLPTVGSRSAEGRAVLNDTWVSAKAGREDYSFNCMRKNEYEEVLLKCEDDRTDLDLLIENANSTIRVLEGLLEIFRKKRGKVFVEEHIPARQLRFIEHLYSDCALEVLECLHQKACSVTPIILKRVKQKKDEWLAYKEEMNKVWAAVFAMNYHKSLDRRSISNSQQDLKSLSTKCLLAEIRNANAASRGSDDFAISVAYGKPFLLVPDLTLQYADAKLHEDVYEILQYSVQKISLNPEQLTRIMHIWKEFLEPLFGIHHGLMEDKELCKNKPKNIGLSYPASDIARTLEDVLLPSAAENVSEGTASHSNNESDRPCDHFEAVSNATFSIAECEEDLDGLNQLKRSEVPEKEEGEITPSCSDDEEDLDSHAIALAKKSLEEGSSVSMACKIIEYGHGDEKEEANISMEVRNATGAAFLGSRIADNMHANCKVEGGGLMMTSTHTGPGESEKFSCRNLPLFTPETSASIGDSVIFYGNDNMYLLLRLYQALYGRVHIAKVHAAKIAESTKGVSSSEIYHNFMQDLREFLDGTADSAKFEGTCRSLAGNECHLLFSLDKFICKLVKQLTAMASDEMAIDLLALHTYEQLHAPGGIEDATYHANVCGLLQDENVYRFERRFETREIFIRLMDGRSGEQALSQMHPKFAKSLSKCILSEACDRLRTSHLFLKRNMPSSSSLDDYHIDVFQNTSFWSDLQLRICFDTSERSYVFATEDYFHRRRKVKKSKIGGVNVNRTSSRRGKSPRSLERVVSSLWLRLHSWSFLEVIREE